MEFPFPAQECAGYVLGLLSVLSHKKKLPVAQAFLPAVL